MSPGNDDTDYVTGSVAEEYDLYNLESMPTLPDNAEIKRVWPEARARDESLGDIAVMLKAGVTEDEDSAVTLGTAYDVIKGAERLLNPDDSAAWEESDINALQVGVKIK